MIKKDIRKIIFAQHLKDDIQLSDLVLKRRTSSNDELMLNTFEMIRIASTSGS